MQFHTIDNRLMGVPAAQAHGGHVPQVNTRDARPSRTTITVEFHGSKGWEVIGDHLDRVADTKAARARAMKEIEACAADGIAARLTFEVTP